jgi:hypothetical protein
MEVPNPRPTRRLNAPSIIKSTNKAPALEKEMSIYDVGSRYVYENKQNYDKLPDDMSDI